MRAGSSRTAKARTPSSRSAPGRRAHWRAASRCSRSSATPPVVAKVANDCGVDSKRLTIIFAPTQSLAGGTQVVARVLEVALHKALELGFPLDRVVEGMGAAPLPPPHPDFVTAMGRTNDAIIYAGSVHLFVTGPADDARSLADRLPSEGSREDRKSTRLNSSHPSISYA